MARNPPRPSFAHREYDVVPPDTAMAPLSNNEMLVRRSFFFGPREVAAIRACLPPLLMKHSTAFEAVTGLLWKLCTMSLAPDADEEMRLVCAVMPRCLKTAAGLRVPRGYYGNLFAVPAAISTAGELCANPVGYAVELVRKAKAEVDAEYLRSVADLRVLRGRPSISLVGAYVVSDLSKFGLGFAGLDYGWGRPAYSGAAAVDPIPGASSFLVAFKNAKGEDGVVVPMSLPAPAMDKFAEEMGKLMNPPADVHVPKTKISAL